MTDPTGGAYLLGSSLCFGTRFHVVSRRFTTPVRRTALVMRCRHICFRDQNNAVPESCHAFPGKASRGPEAPPLLYDESCTVREHPLPWLYPNHTPLNSISGSLSALVLPIDTVPHAAIDVEVFEILNMNDFEADGEFEGTTSRSVVEVYGGVHPIDDDCEGTSCIGMLTRVCQLR